MFLLDFSLLPGENIISRYLLKELDSNTILTEDFQMIYVELPKFHITEIEDLQTEADIWFYLLKNIQTLTEQSRMEILKKKPDLKNAFGVLETYKKNYEQIYSTKYHLKHHRLYLSMFSLNIRATMIHLSISNFWNISPRFIVGRSN